MRAIRVYEEELYRWENMEKWLEEIVERNSISNSEYKKIKEEMLETENPFCVFNRKFLEKDLIGKMRKNFKRKKKMNFCSNCPYFIIKNKKCYQKGEPVWELEQSKDVEKGIEAVEDMINFLEVNRNEIIRIMEELHGNTQKKS